MGFYCRGSEAKGFRFWGLSRGLGDYHRALMTRIGFLYRALYIRATIRDLYGFNTIGASMIRIGFWDPLHNTLMRSPPKTLHW